MLKNIFTAYFFCVCFGTWGVHKFYLGQKRLGILYLLTLGGFFWIGCLIDLFTLSRQVKEVNLLLMGKLSDYDMPYRYEETEEDRVLTRQEKEKIVLLVAKKYKGRITPMEIAADSELSIEEADEILKKIAGQEFAEIKVSQSGGIFYQFYGFLSDEEKNNADGVLD